MNTFQWVIPQDSMVTAKSIDGLSDVVVTINALREISDEGILVQTPVCLGLTPPIEGFIPYEQLTKDIVEGWLNAGTDTESLDAQLVSKLDDIKNPKTQVLPNPF
jgi:hypothetical protein